MVHEGEKERMIEQKGGGERGREDERGRKGWVGGGGQ